MSDVPDFRQGQGAEAMTPFRAVKMALWRAFRPSDFAVEIEGSGHDWSFIMRQSCDGRLMRLRFRNGGCEISDVADNPEDAA